jgi:hypothetical protein
MRRTFVHTSHNQQSPQLRTSGELEQLTSRPELRTVPTFVQTLAAELDAGKICICVPTTHEYTPFANKVSYSRSILLANVLAS